MSASCVTKTIVTPSSRLSRFSVSMISCEVRVSRLPVGSSARRRLGELIRCRAIGEPEAAQSLERAGETRLAPGLALVRIEQRQGDVFRRAGARQQIEAL